MDKSSDNIAKILAFKLKVLQLFDHKINTALINLELPLHPELLAKLSPETIAMEQALQTLSRKKVKAALAVAAIVGVGGALYVASQNGIFQGHANKSSELKDLNDSQKNDAGKVIEPVVQVFVEDSGKLETKSITSSPHSNIENVEQSNGSQLEPFRPNE